MKQLTLEEKQSIQAQLQAYVAKFPSQNRAVNSLTGVSAATISVILNGKFDNISDEMFLRIRSMTSPTRSAEWTICETAAFRELTLLLADAQANQNVSWIVGNAGVGKTTAAHEYAAHHDNAFVISCSEDMRRGDFIRELARVLGVKLTQSSLRDKLMTVTDELRVLDKPLLIFDEGDKLMDSVFYYFISIYNALEGQCGIIFLSTEYIKRRMSIGLDYNKKGYDEIFSRIGRRFIDLTPASSHEVAAICRANGLNAERAISDVLKEARTVVSKTANPWDKKQAQDYFDMRRVKKSVHKNKILAQTNK